jgi:hypothetical protein
MSSTHGVPANNALRIVAQQACGQSFLRTSCAHERIGLALHCCEGEGLERRFLGKKTLCKLLLAHFHSRIYCYSFAGSRWGFIRAAAPLARNVSGSTEMVVFGIAIRAWLNLAESENFEHPKPLLVSDAVHKAHSIFFEAYRACVVATLGSRFDPAKAKPAFADLAGLRMKNFERYSVVF